MEALNTLKKDKAGWPPLNNLEAEEIVTAHRIEKPTPSSSQGGEQMIWDTMISKTVTRGTTQKLVVHVRELTKRPRTVLIPWSVPPISAQLK